MFLINSFLSYLLGTIKQGVIRHLLSEIRKLDQQEEK